MSNTIIVSDRIANKFKKIYAKENKKMVLVSISEAAKEILKIKG